MPSRAQIQIAGIGLLVLLAVLSPVFGENLLRDPGFDLDPNRSPWELWDDTDLASWAGVDGSRGAYFRDWNDYGDAPPHGGGIAQRVPVTSGRRYAADIRVKREPNFSGTNVQMSVTFFDSRYVPLASKKVDLLPALTADWKRYGFTVLAPPQAGFARFAVEFSGAGHTNGQQQACLLDEAVLEEQINP